MDPAYSSAFYSCLSWCVGGLVASHIFLREVSIWNCASVPVTTFRNKFQNKFIFYIAAWDDSRVRYGVI